jgi:hypothetical protein
MIRTCSLLPNGGFGVWPSRGAYLDEMGMAWKDAQGAPQKRDLQSLEHRMAERWHLREWGHSDAVGTAWSLRPCAVRAAPADFSRGFKLYTYASWFAHGTWVRGELWTRQTPRHPA